MAPTPDPHPGDTDWPSNYDGCHLVGRYVGLDGLPIAGSLTLSAAPDVLLDFDDTDPVIIVPKPLTLLLDAGGNVDAVIPATDDPDISPQRFTYLVVENFPGGRRYNIEAPYGQTVDLTVVVPQATADGTPVVRGPRGVDGLLQGVIVAGSAAPINGASEADLSTLVFKKSLNFSDVPDVPAARGNLGLGSAALNDATDFVPTGAALLAADNLSDIPNVGVALAHLGLGAVLAELAALYTGTVCHDLNDAVDPGLYLVAFDAANSPTDLEDPWVVQVLITGGSLLQVAWKVNSDDDTPGLYIRNSPSPPVVGDWNPWHMIFDAAAVWDNTLTTVSAQTGWSINHQGTEVRNGVAYMNLWFTRTGADISVPAGGNISPDIEVAQFSTIFPNIAHAMPCHFVSTTTNGGCEIGTDGILRLTSANSGSTIGNGDLVRLFVSFPLS